MQFKKQSEFLKKINSWGFSVNSISRIVKGIDDIIIRKLTLLRSSLDYDIDGLVFKVNDLKVYRIDWVIRQIHLDGE